MDAMLKKRLILLEKAGEIDSSISDVVIDFSNQIERDYSVKITEDNGSMLITHLAMALSRIKKGEEIENIDEEVFREVKASKIYTELSGYYKMIEEKLGINIPNVEKDYIALHICTLLNKNRR